METGKGLLVIILGPTATGKSSLAIELARHYNSVVISADSRQFYREMKTGTCRITREEAGGIPVFFSGQISIEEYYSAGRFESEVISFLSHEFKKRKVVIMAGGTGLYIDAVCNGIGDTPGIDLEVRQKVLDWYMNRGEAYLLDRLKELDPVYYQQVDRKNMKRVIRALEVIEQTGIAFSSIRKNKPVARPFSILKIGLELQRDELYDKINGRVDSMMEAGLLEEVRELAKHRNKVALQTVGYQELLDYLDHKVTLEESVRLIKRNTRHYAKRQLTWFKRDLSVHWFKPLEKEKMISLIDAGITEISEKGP